MEHRFWILGALLAAGLGVSNAHAQQLQDCTQGDPGDGILPIGWSGDPGHTWKAELYDWLLNHDDPVQFEWTQWPLQFVAPVEALGRGNHYVGSTCHPSWPPNTQTVQSAPWLNFTSDERLHVEQWWYLRNGGVGGSLLGALPWGTFDIDPATFTLGAMEHRGTCEAWTPQLGWGHMIQFFGSWNYAGNPFAPSGDESETLKLRGAAWLFMQLIMLDFEHHGSNHTYAMGSNYSNTIGLSFVHPNEAGGLRSGHEFASVLNMLAWNWSHIDDLPNTVLPASVRDAVEEALFMFAERVWLWNPYNPQSNRGIRSVEALYQVWEATGQQAVWNYYQDVLAQFYDTPLGNYHPAGYWRDDYHHDLSYGHSNMRSAVRLLQLDPNLPPWAYDATASAFDLSAHLAVQDVNGRWTSPNVTNSRTSQGPLRMNSLDLRNSYYGGVPKYLPAVVHELPYAHAAMRDEGTMGPLAAQNGFLPLDPSQTDFHENLACLGTRGVNSLNTALANGWGGANALGQIQWPHAGTFENFHLPPISLEDHHLGVLPDWHAQAGSVGDLQSMPVELDGPHLRSFDDEFVFMKHGRVGDGREWSSVVHVGPVGQLGSLQRSGLGGGQIMSFASPQTGPVMLARQRGRNNTPMDSFPDWRSWPVHTVWIRVDHFGTDHLATPMRILDPQQEVYMVSPGVPRGDIPDALAGIGPWAAPPTVPDTLADGFVARVHGPIRTIGHRESDGTVFPGILDQPIDYERSFVGTGLDLFVRTFVGEAAASDQTDILEAWESIPIWNRDVTLQAGQPDTEIHLASNVLGFVDATSGTNGQIIPEVESVMVHRAGGTMRILFDEPRSVQVPAAWDIATLRARALLVDRTDDLFTAGGGAFTYRIEIFPLGDGDGEEEPPPPPDMQ